MIYLTVFLPLLGAALSGLLGRQLGDRLSHLITASFVTLSAIFSYLLFYRVAVVPEHSLSELYPLLNWFEVGELSASWALRLDTLTAVMLVVVNTVSAVVHWYSKGYMHEEKSITRFMAYLSLFTFAMLMLVTSNNLIQMFFGWEGVGLCSYLLIGYYYEKESAKAAAIKAFVVNRVGDFGFTLGIAALFWLTGSVVFEEVFQALPGKEEGILTVAALLLFVGAMGKSAQLGLHTWLPDAMEGPTPVSALIHAATMVTAGVFMIARMSPLFELAPFAQQIVAIFGAMTALFAATVGLTQFDIKRVIAYSTCSQLGYMFFALGVGAYNAAIFHLMTHAFFKALLFLGAGSVIYALHHEQDMRKMGGLWKKLPVTYSYMLLGSLALAGVGIPGVFGLAGYYSKDFILESAYGAHSSVGLFAYGIGVLVAFMTAFYSFRLLFLTFHGKFRGDQKVYDHAHEAPVIMSLPMIFLAVGAIVAGLLGYDYFSGEKAEGFWGTALVFKEELQSAAHHVPELIKTLPLYFVLSGIALAALFYLVFPNMPKRVVTLFKPIHQFFFRKWYFDELYNVLFVKPVFALGRLFWKGDMNIVDRFGPNGIAALSQRLSRFTSRFQSGHIYQYASTMFFGVLLLLTWFVVRAI